MARQAKRGHEVHLFDAVFAQPAVRGRTLVRQTPRLFAERGRGQGP
jgi:hypothetical protein